jgi:hypothetical protein
VASPPTLLSNGSRGQLVPGQAAIICNCPNAKLNGQRVICEQYNTDLNEWMVKGDRFPLSVGMSLKEQFLEGAGSFSSESQMQPSKEVSEPQGNPVIRSEDLLKTTLESCLKAMALDEPTKVTVGSFVNILSERVNAILTQGAGKGPNGKCPFSSCYEVHIFYQFCLLYLGVWSGHNVGEDEDLDAAFYFQLATICEVLNNLDTSAVFLPEEIDQNIQLLKREALWPNWFDGEMKKGEAAARQCLAIGREWKLEESECYQNALAKLEGNVPSNVQN